MFAWLKKLLAQRKALRKVDAAIENLPRSGVDTSNFLPLDPGKSDLR